MSNNLHKEIERKYLVLIPDNETLASLPKYSKTSIVQTYLSSDNKTTSRRVRKRGSKQLGYKYYYTEKISVAFGEKIEMEIEVDENEYERLLKEAKPNCKPIIKDRYCFYHNGQLFELDIYTMSDKYATLEIELDDINKPVELPDYIDVVKDVTGDKRYSNASLSLSQRLDIL